MSELLDREVREGQAVYSRLGLSLYDLMVLKVSNRWIWECPTPRLLALYDENVSAHHLDIGVGTGYYLDRCTFPTSPRIALVDLNPNSLEVTARRIARFAPMQFERNALEPFGIEDEKFDSIGINYLLHCLPGDLSRKAIVFDHAVEALNPGGVVFGATLLQGGVERTGMARRLMAFYNRKGIFHNTGDTLDALREELARRFEDWNVEVRGCAALFRARRPRGKATPGREAGAVTSEQVLAASAGHPG